MALALNARRVWAAQVLAHSPTDLAVGSARNKCAYCAASLGLIFWLFLTYSHSFEVCHFDFSSKFLPTFLFVIHVVSHVNVGIPTNG